MIYFYLLLLSVCVRGCIGITGHFQKSQGHFHESVLLFLCEFWGLNLGCQAWTESKKLVKVPTEPSHWPRKMVLSTTVTLLTMMFGDMMPVCWVEWCRHGYVMWPQVLFNFSIYPWGTILSTIIKLRTILLRHSSLSYVRAVFATYPVDTWRIS